MSDDAVDRDKVLDKCRKLYAMAHHETTNPHEAATAMRQWRRMMDKHGITEADLQKSEFGQGVAFEGIQIPLWFKYISIAVAKYNDVICSGIRGSDRVGRFTFKGYKEDVMLANMMMDYLENAMNRQWETFRKDRDTCVHGKAARSSFNKGFALAVQARLYELCAEREEEIRQAAEENPGTALVAVKMSMVHEKFGVQKVSRRNDRKVSDGGAYHAGRIAGENTSLSRQVTRSGGQKRLAA